MRVAVFSSYSTLYSCSLGSLKVIMPTFGRFIFFIGPILLYFCSNSISFAYCSSVTVL